MLLAASALGLRFFDCRYTLQSITLTLSEDSIGTGPGDLWEQGTVAGSPEGARAYMATQQLMAV